MATKNQVPPNARTESTTGQQSQAHAIADLVRLLRGTAKGVVSRRMRQAADLHSQSWSGLRSFERLTDPEVCQTSGLIPLRPMRRLAQAIVPHFEMANSALDGFYEGLFKVRRLNYLFRLFRRSQASVPKAFDDLRIINTKTSSYKAALAIRVLHEYDLLFAGAGAPCALMQRLWRYYPRYGIPCGLRPDGTVILFVGPPGFTFEPVPPTTLKQLRAKRFRAELWNPILK